MLFCSLGFCKLLSKPSHLHVTVSMLLLQLTYLRLHVLFLLPVLLLLVLQGLPETLVL